jgi:copper chaperone CopZ
MKTYRFKTNINCGGCINAVKPHLDADQGIKVWQVNTADPGKILTVETESLTEEEVCQVVAKAGFKAEKLHK